MKTWLSESTDNDSNYTISKAFRKFLSILRFKLEHIYYDTPQNRKELHIELFYKTLLMKEKIWSNDFQNYQESESAIKDTFVDYNQNKIEYILLYLDI